MYERKNQLIQYSNEELYGFLENNEKIDPDTLAYICSEILRRLLDKDLKVEESHEKQSEM